MRLGMCTIALALSGCGTALYLTPRPLAPETLSQLRRGGEQLQCREQPSSEFALFLVCPGKNRAIGFSASHGKQALTCVDLFPRNCKKLAKSLLAAGDRPLEKTVPNAP